MARLSLDYCGQSGTRVEILVPWLTIEPDWSVEIRQRVEHLKASMLSGLTD